MEYIEFQKELHTRLHENPNFKSQLMNNPVDTVRAILGKKINSDATVVVDDQSDPNTIFLNIPPSPAVGSGELTLEELEAIVGGDRTFVNKSGYGWGWALHEAWDWLTGQ